LLLLQLIRWLKVSHKIKPFIILLRGGPLVEEFQKEGTVFLWNNAASGVKPNNIGGKIIGKVAEVARRRLRKIYLNHKVSGFKAETVYLNTAAALNFLHRNMGVFKRHVKILHCHEMPYTIKKYVPDSIEYLFSRLNKIIVVNKTIEQYFITRGVDRSKVLRVPEYLCRKFPAPTPEQADAFKVVSAGLGSWRKGIDLFVLCAYYFSKFYAKPFTFTWIGFIHPSVLSQLQYDIKQYGLSEQIRFAGEIADTSEYLNKSDVFFLASREDPYPLVMLEAAWFEKPVLYFNNTGGAAEFVNDDQCAVDPFDVYEAAQRLRYFAEHADFRKEKGQQLKTRVSTHTIENVGKTIFEFIQSEIQERNNNH
jgi:glycosyltransferase involved in cell wall biosynthesis